MKPWTFPTSTNKKWNMNNQKPKPYPGNSKTTPKTTSPSTTKHKSNTPPLYALRTTLEAKPSNPLPQDRLNNSITNNDKKASSISISTNPTK